jgi:hypothetical protein
MDLSSLVPNGRRLFQIWELKLNFHLLGIQKVTPPNEVMRELGKYFRIYCNETHKKWAELIPYVEKWMNSSLSSATGYTPIELMGENNKLKQFDTFRLPSQIPSKQKEDLPTKLLKVYSRMKLKSEKKKRRKILM